MIPIGQTIYGIEPLIRSVVAEVPPAPALFALAAFTYAPGSTFGPAAGPGPVAFRMLAGQLSFAAQGPLFFTRSSGMAAASEVVSPGTSLEIGPGDQLLVPGNTLHTARNCGSTTAAMIGLAIFQQVPPQQFPTGVQFKPLVMGMAKSLPAAPIAVLVDRIGLPADESIARTYPGPAVYHLNDGALEARVGAGEVLIVRAGKTGPLNAPQQAMAGEPLALSAGDGLFAQADAEITFRCTSLDRTELIRGVALPESVVGKKYIADRYFNEMWNDGDLSLVNEVVSADFLNHNRLAGQLPGRHGISQLVQRWRAAFPDCKVSVACRVTEGERVATCWKMLGTHLDSFLGVAATGRVVNLTGITIFRVSAGTIHEGWEFWDGARLLEQLGILGHSPPNS
jgi:steroid delta-isomerase-like uncharacterized protein